MKGNILSIILLVFFIGSAQANIDLTLCSNKKAFLKAITEHHIRNNPPFRGFDSSGQPIQDLELKNLVGYTECLDTSNNSQKKQSLKDKRACKRMLKNLNTYLTKLHDKKVIEVMKFSRTETEDTASTTSTESEEKCLTPNPMYNRFKKMGKILGHKRNKKTSLEDHVCKIRPKKQDQSPFLIRSKEKIGSTTKIDDKTIVMLKKRGFSSLYNVLPDGRCGLYALYGATQKGDIKLTSDMNKKVEAWISKNLKEVEKLFKRSIEAQLSGADRNKADLPFQISPLLALINGEIDEIKSDYNKFYSNRHIRSNLREQTKNANPEIAFSAQREINRLEYFQNNSKNMPSFSEYVKTRRGELKGNFNHMVKKNKEIRQDYQNILFKRYSDLFLSKDIAKDTMDGQLMQAMSMVLKKNINVHKPEDFRKPVTLGNKAHAVNGQLDILLSKGHYYILKK